MDDRAKIELSEYRLKRAKDSLETAQILFEANKYLDCNSRSYYAVFHAIRAILALEGKDFKRHKDVITYFNFNYVKADIFPKDLGKKIHALSDMREESDYVDFYISSREEAQEQLNVAVYAIGLIERYLKLRKE